MSATRHFMLPTKSIFARLNHNMKRLSPATHGILDYVTVLLLFISPSLFGMETSGSALCYTLAIVHLLLTLFTDFPAGALKIIPLRIHGLIELIVSVGLLGAAIAFRISANTVSFYYYLIFSVMLFIIWFLSEYKTAVRAAS